MSFITGLLLIDASASALNNLGSIPGARTDNTVGVKMISTKEGAYPYVSAQAFRYWLRDTLTDDPQWQAAPVYREEKVAYPDANPILYWDDDLLGYMRAPSTKTTAVDKRKADSSRQNETPTIETITRVSPFRVSTLVSVAPVNIVEDFGVMARQEGNPVPYEHQFYRATLRGLFSLDLGAAGTFSYKQKTGFRNLDEERMKQAAQKGLEHLESQKSYRLPQGTRLRRVMALLDGLARLEGGAKQSLHYTDVAPPLVVLAVTKGGNHIFGHVVGANNLRQPVVKTEALAEAMTVFSDQLLSAVYVGWTQGYLDEERAKFMAWAEGRGNVRLSHPRQAFIAVRDDLQRNPGWMG